MQSTYSQFLLKERIVLILNRFLQFFKPKTVLIRNLIEMERNFAFLLDNGYKIALSGKKNVITYSDPLLGNYAVLIRRYSSDYQVFQQIMIEREYQYFLDYVLQNSSKTEIINILDGGGNIGLTSLYFSKMFPEANIVCIEPDNTNIAMVEEQIKLNELHNVVPLQAAIWNKNEELILNRQFRDGQEWSFSVTNIESDVSANDTYKVNGMTLENVISSQNWDHIDLLKLDIEGAERFVFENIETAGTFLPRTKFVAMEIHEEFNVTKRVEEIFSYYNFSFIYSGELIIARNTSF